jgi:hypothetical protein
LNYSDLNATNDTFCLVTGSPAHHDLHEAGCYIDFANPRAANIVNGLALTGVNRVGPLIGGAQPQSLKGNPLAYSPSHQVSANISYTFKFQTADLTLAGVWNWRSQFYDHPFSAQEWLALGG